MSRRAPPLPERSTLRKLGIALLVLAVVAGAGCAGIADDGGNETDVNGTDGSGNETNVSLEGVSLIDHVPAEQNMVMHLDMAITDDETTQKFLESGSDEAEEESEDVDDGEFQESLEEFEAETGLDPHEFEEALFFGEYDDVPDSVDDAESEEQSGLIANTGWTTSELIGAIESNDSVELTEMDYEESGVFYELESTEEPDDDPLYIGMLGEGAYVMGDESSVRGSLDIAYADGDALSGTLYDAYDRTEDGFATVALTVPEDTTDDVDESEMGADVAQNMEVLSGTYYTEGDEIGVEGRITMSNENYATQLSASLTVLMTEAKQSEDPPEALQFLDIGQDGTDVTFTYASDVETLIDATDSQ